MTETLNKYFGLKANNTNIRTEVIAGITTFVTAMYIIVVNPAILSATGLPFNAVLTATVLLSLLYQKALLFWEWPSLI